MRRDTLVRIGGAAAILAGVMRAAGSFLSWADSEVERQSLYFIVDLLLLLGVFAAYVQNHEPKQRRLAVPSYCPEEAHALDGHREIRAMLNWQSG